MYTVHFLQGEISLTQNARRIMERSVLKVYEDVHEELDLEECSVFVLANQKKIPDGDMFLGFPYDQTAVYLFFDGDLVREVVSHDREMVEQSVTEHLYRSLYATARAKHMGLGADCGLLEEAVIEGLSEIFVTEKMFTDPRERYILFSKERIKQLWEKMRLEFDEMSPDIEKWFWGSESENLPPLTACSVGFAIAEAYLDIVKKESVEVLTVPARDMAVLQNRY